MSIIKNISKSINEVKKYKAGASVNDYIKKYNIDKDSLIRLASNENVYGPSPLIAEKIQNITKNLSIYPETDYAKLKNAFANYANVETANITVGNGSDELFLLTSLVFAQNRLGLIPEPTFTWYRTCLLLSNAKVVMVPINEKNDFRLTTEDIINNIEKILR
ncbi:unnamed protein product [marine sediment metagenome]|uniref:histidinol-phosphate transaminase n=1 Tax=marine sediment metagenome TaxID=412755 RepID=X1BLH0_9ZZZZ